MKPYSYSLDEDETTLAAEVDRYLAAHGALLSPSEHQHVKEFERAGAKAQISPEIRKKQRKCRKLFRKARKHYKSSYHIDPPKEWGVKQTIAWHVQEGPDRRANWAVFNASSILNPRGLSSILLIAKKWRKVTWAVAKLSKDQIKEVMAESYYKCRSCAYWSGDRVEGEWGQCLHTMSILSQATVQSKSYCLEWDAFDVEAAIEAIEKREQDDLRKGWTGLATLTNK